MRFNQAIDYSLVSEYQFSAAGRNVLLKMCSFILLVPEYAKLYAIQMIQFFLFKNGKWKKVIKTLFYGDRDIIN